MSVNTAIVGVGSNLGSRQASIRSAQWILDARTDITVTAASSLYETDPVGPPQPRFLNAALRLETTLTPHELLTVLLRTEQRLGRDRCRSERWGPRSVDLDLLWDSRGAVSSDALQVPHAALEERSFALTPLVEVAPELGEKYAGAIARTGGALTPWDREAQCASRVDQNTIEVTAETDTLVDACALATLQSRGRCKLSATHHRIIDSSASAFGETLAALFDAGFHVGCGTVSHCSNTQWFAHFHGVNPAIPPVNGVRLVTTSGETRNHHARLTLRVGNP